MMDILDRMQLYFIKVNLFIFILFSIVMTLIAEKMPTKIYYYKKWLYRERQWEDGGHIYERIFGVKSWKAKLPDISDFMKWRFNKKHFAKNNNNYLFAFLTESCKAEFTHWMIIMSTLIFKFWNNWSSVLLIMSIAMLLNLPYIIIQRYNRPRLKRLLRRNYEHDYEFVSAKT